MDFLAQKKRMDVIDIYLEKQPSIRKTAAEWKKESEDIAKSIKIKEENIEKNIKSENIQSKVFKWVWQQESIWN